jgi:hypothetical protein
MISLPESDIRSLNLVRVTSIFCIVLVLSVLIAGCVNLDYKPNRDIVVVKLTPNASLEWSRVIDLGGDDYAHKIIQTPDNNLVIGTTIFNQKFVGLMKISPDNKLLWNISFFDKNCIPSRIIIGRNGDIITADGNICRLNSDGVIIWNRSMPVNGYISAIAETPDNGYVVGGGNNSAEQPVIAKIDPTGNITWQTSLAKEGFKDAVQLIFIPQDGKGYVAQTVKEVIRVDNNGNYTGVTHLGWEVPETDNGTIDGQPLIRYIAYSPGLIFYNQTGMPVAQMTLKNASTIVSRTTDGGYISAGLADSSNFKAIDGNLRILKLKPDGTRDWERNVSGVLVTGVNQIIQTSDGGYALIGENDKEWR